MESTQWLARDTLSRRVIGPPLIAKVKAEWSNTNLVCSGVASFLVPWASSHSCLH